MPYVQGRLWRTFVPETKVDREWICLRDEADHTAYDLGFQVGTTGISITIAYTPQPSYRGSGFAIAAFGHAICRAASVQHVDNQRHSCTTYGRFHDCNGEKPVLTLHQIFSTQLWKTGGDCG